MTPSKSSLPPGTSPVSFVFCFSFSEHISNSVASVTPTQVLYTVQNPDGETEQHSIPTNFVLWSTGIAMNPFTTRVTSLLPNQVHKKAIVVDSHLRVLGAPKGEVYAIGDCSTVSVTVLISIMTDNAIQIETSLLNHFLELVDESDKDKNGKIDFGEWEDMGENYSLSCCFEFRNYIQYTVAKIKQRIPMAEVHLAKVKELFQLYDSDADNNLSMNELLDLLVEIGKRITSLPATAQVASQQGKFLGRKLHKLARVTSPGYSMAKFDESVSKPFKYRHLGSLAYIGNAAVFDFGQYSFMGGLAAMYAWRSIYWNEQVSARTRALLMIDWIIRCVFVKFY